MSEIGKAVDALRTERVGLAERIRAIDVALETLTPLIADDSEPMVLSAKSQRHIVRGAQSSASNEGPKSEPADGVSVFQRQSDQRWCGTVELPGSKREKRRRKYFYADSESAIWAQIENWREGLLKAVAREIFPTRVVGVEEPYVPKEPVDVGPPEIMGPALEEPDEDDEPRAIKLDWVKEFRLDTIRARIVKLLSRYGPRSADEIASTLGLEPRVVEEPLTILHEGGILKLDKDDYRLVVNIPYLTEARA
jgi:DNA-binding transcriptional ArsR family regulator